jgi:hypothetical protein
LKTTRFWQCSPVATPLLHRRDRLVHVPHLVRVQHQLAVRPDRLAHHARAPQIVIWVGAHLDLEVRPALGQGLPAEALQLRVVVAEPAGRGDVGGVAVAQHLALATGAAGDLALEQGPRLLRLEGIADVPEVDRSHDLLRGEVGQVLPERLVRPQGQQVPDGVHDRREREVDDALLRPEPAQLAVSREPPPEGPRVRLDLV